ncbi:MAG: transcription-repair coupling factor [Corallococcus sp.]|nr:transcription-repair coupling factor [Corallococcus sp.]
MTDIWQKLHNVSAYNALLNDVRGNRFTAAFGVQQNEKLFAVSAFSEFVLYVTSDYVDARRICRTLCALGGKYVFVPYNEDTLLYRQRAGAVSRERNAALASILDGSAKGAVICAETLMQPLLPKEYFAEKSFCVKTGDIIEIRDFVKQLIDCSYTRVDAIDGEGQFTSRGDIVEIQTSEKRVRFDFFDNQVESVRLVESDGKSGENINEVRFFPLGETVGADARVLKQVGELISKRTLSADATARLNQIFGSLSIASGGEKVDNIWLAPFLERGRISDYLPDNAVVVWDEPKLIHSKVNFLYNEQDTRLANLLAAGEVLPAHAASLLERGGVFEAFGKLRQLSLQTMTYGGTFFRPQVTRSFSTVGCPSYNALSDSFKKDIQNWLYTGYEVAVFVGKEGVDSAQRQFAEWGVYMTTDSAPSSGSSDGKLFSVPLERGFISHSNKLVVLGARDVGRSMSEAKLSKSKNQAFLSVEKGDYVVHDTHGIGLCEGIVKMDNGGGSKDYIAVLYKNGDRLYVPVESSNLLTRYSGGENPTLSKLGGEDFERVKSKVKSSIKAMSLDLLALYAEREKPRGFKYNIDKYLQEEFASAFPYSETSDQLKCIEEINADLSSNRIMDRILVGDVGYGKTEVAMRAAFNVVANGYQVAVLVPTTILAEQHFKTFSERMTPFDVKVECLNRFRTAAEQKQIIESAKDGKIDILIGTHRLLSKDIAFAKLGLLILDEEQRFGVEHKEQVKDRIRKVDALTLSATPIPRTLHMALSGIRDISTITTPPVERLAVATFVVEDSPALMRDVILRELNRGGQVFLLYNRVETIDRFASQISELVPEAKITVAHGQMREIDLEDAVYKFQQGKSNLLVCTTIIENGIDIPNANTLIVYDADNLGLSQLYQLRGRVGRSNKLAYAYFVYRENKVLSETAFKRLSSVSEYSELGSGFKIAMKDLEIRGAGNILGREQHGHMVKVGYDMYARLLKESIAELKGEKTEVKRDARMEIDVDAYAPESYVPSATERMDLYRRIADCQTVAALEDLQESVRQIYGELPRQLYNLFEVSRLKVLALGAKVVKVTVKNGAASLEFAAREDMIRAEVLDAVKAKSTFVRFAPTGFAVVFSSKEFIQRARLVFAVREFLESIQT